MAMTPGEKKAFNKGFEAGANSVEEGLPGWFGTFADMMTLLFAFFVLLAAISTMDPVKLQEMANSEGKSLGSKIKKDGAAEEEGEFEPIEKLAQMKKEMEEAIEEPFAFDDGIRAFNEWVTAQGQESLKFPEDGFGLGPQSKE